MNIELLEQLQDLQHRDIDTRKMLLEEGRLFGEYAQEMRDVHRQNAKAPDKS